MAADKLTFTGAMAVGDELSIYVDLKRQGRTSMTLARAIARMRDCSHEFEVATGSSRLWRSMTTTSRAGGAWPSPLAGEGRHAKRCQGEGDGCCSGRAKTMRSAPTETDIDCGKYSGPSGRWLQVPAASSDRSLYRRLSVSRAAADRRARRRPARRWRRRCATRCLFARAGLPYHSHLEQRLFTNEEEVWRRQF